MAVDVITEIVIERPVELVYAYTSAAEHRFADAPKRHCTKHA
jgi:hypothetical protein